MAYFIDVPKFIDSRGSLCVIENLLPFSIKRFYYIFDVKGERGGHRHKRAVQALICLSGSCEVFVNNGEKKNNFILNKPNKCLIIETQDWHTMSCFSNTATLLVLASEYYDVNDYIDEPYYD
jgi:quercetin dioxygenase-like cupin family protein